MEIDVTNRIHYNNYDVTNERPRGYYLDLSDIPSDYDIKFHCDPLILASLTIIGR